MRTSIIFAALALLTTSTLAIHSDPSHSTSAGHLARRDSSGDCTSSAIAAGGLCGKKCPANQTPQNDGTCACHTPFHLVKHGGAHKTICQPRCVEGYVLSANFTTCVCAATSFESHDKTKCWSKCPAGTYSLKSKKLNAPGSCPACHTPGVATCTGRGPGFALTCVPGSKYFFDIFTQSCVLAAACFDGFYADPATNQCLKCADDGAIHCTGGGAHASTICGSDTMGVVKYLNSANSCVSSCGDGFYQQRLQRDEGKPVRRRASTLVPPIPVTQVAGNVCVACSDNGALACSGTGTGTTLICAIVTTGAQLFLDPSSSTCVVADACPADSFPSLNNGSPACLSCGSEVANCNSDGTVLNCIVGYSLILNQCLPTVPTVPTVPVCPTGNYFDIQLNLCAACDWGTATCIGTGSGNALTCGETCYNSPTSCAQYYLDVTLTCVDLCPGNTFGDKSGAKPICSLCGDNALTCKDAATATSCTDTTYLSAENQCLESCPDSYFAQDNTPSSDRRKRHFRSNQRKRQIASTQYKVCVACDPGVLQCYGNDGYSDEQCAIASGGEVQLYLNGNGNHCIPADDCEETYFATLNNGNPSCLSCVHPGVATCSDASTALTCLDGWYYLGAQTSCVEECPSGTVVSGTQCVNLGPYNDPTEAWLSQACYEDGTGGTNLLSVWFNENSAPLAPADCLNTCTNSFSMCGVEDGGACYAANINSIPWVASDQCTTPCSLDNTYTCGGTSSIYVYAFNGY